VKGIFPIPILANGLPIMDKKENAATLNLFITLLLSSIQNYILFNYPVYYNEEVLC
jgi:hypothetical protein